MVRGGLLILIRVAPVPAAVGVVLPAVAEGAVPLVRERVGVGLGLVVRPAGLVVRSAVAVLAVSLIRVGGGIGFLVVLVAVALVAVLLVAGLLTVPLLRVALLLVALPLVALLRVTLTLVVLA